MTMSKERIAELDPEGCVSYKLTRDQLYRELTTLVYRAREIAIENGYCAHWDELVEEVQESMTVIRLPFRNRHLTVEFEVDARDPNAFAEALYALLVRQEQDGVVIGKPSRHAVFVSDEEGNAW